MIEWRIARVEILRALRRDSHLALLLGSLLVFLAPAILCLWIGAGGGLFSDRLAQPSEGILLLELRGLLLGAGDATPVEGILGLRSLLVYLEFLLLPAIAFFLAQRSLSEELRSGSWTLLRQAPVPQSALLRGKLLGAAAGTWLFHSLAMTALALPGNSYCIPPGLFLAELLLAPFFCIPYAVDGLADAAVARQGRGLYLGHRLILVARVALPAALLHQQLDFPASILSKYLHLHGVLLAGVPLNAIALEIGSLGAFLALLALLQVGGAALVWFLYLRRTLP